ncbi:HET-domain-containing protein [Xylaria arbuscula]|nr:HET-domain-containing protein [Xylaria arbuscula]
MSPNILDDLSIKQWLEQRKEAAHRLKDALSKGESQRWLDERKAFPAYTSSAPHSCKHCGNIVVELGDSSDMKWTSLDLPYNLPESVLVAREGCALYQMLVDCAFDSDLDEAKAAWRGEGDLSYSATFFPESLPMDSAHLLFTITAHLHDGSERKIDTVGLFIWALEGSPACVHVSTRPYELDYQSSRSTAWGRDCIEYCQLEHSACNSSREGHESKEFISTSSIPSRLLKLSPDGDENLHVQIIGRDMRHPINTHDVSHRGFAILSYCWGGSQPVQLTRKTITSTSSYPAANLPKTLADAVWFTYKLGLEYLWIDSLCILQDDIEDKRREIPRMGKYYGDATVTICAASADTCSKGFLSNRLLTDDPFKYLFGPIQLSAKTKTGEIGTIQIIKEPDYLNGHRQREPIVERGWTLQESLLSRRILVFSSDHLYFSCREANASCGGSEPVPRSRVMGMHESRVPGISTISSRQRISPALSTWDVVIEEYTQRQLGCFDDKLPAISAMAASLVSTAREERAQELRYCAGLMLDLQVDNKRWKGQLLWSVRQSASNVPEPGSYLSPSWSWASLQAPVLKGQSTFDDTGEADEIRLLDFGTQLEDASNPFGAVTGGFIKLWARTCLFSTIDRSSVNMLFTRDLVYSLSEEVEKRPSRYSLVVCPDTAEMEDMIASGGLDVLLVELITTRPRNRFSRFPCGLIVTQTEELAPETTCYKRIGIFEFMSTARSKSEDDEAVQKARAVFESGELREVYII